MALSANVQGALWMSASMAGFVLNDTLIKSVSGEVPLFQAILIRGLAATALIGLVVWRRGLLRPIPPGRDRRLILWRMVGEIGGTSLFLTALFNMPIANATAILQALPLAVTVAAALFLGERVGWRRYGAVAVGLAGVLLIVRPGTEGFNVYSLSALAAVGFIVIRDLSTRGLSTAVPSLLVTLITSSAITVFAGAITVFGTWEPVSAETLMRLFGAGMLLLIGYHAGIVAMRVGEIGFVSPFRYSNLIWAIALGILVFGDVPGPLELIGAGIVVATGLYTLHRERVVRLSR